MSLTEILNQLDSTAQRENNNVGGLLPKVMTPTSCLYQPL